jgi:hypothetical protein
MGFQCMWEIVQVDYVLQCTVSSPFPINPLNYGKRRGKYVEEFLYI